MKIILASSNSHKLKEFKVLLNDYEIYSSNDFIAPFEIEENGKSFKENAKIKSLAVFKALKNEVQENYIVLSDDSGICVDALGGAPGIYSARYSLEANDKNNRLKLISELEKLKLNESFAHYVCALSLGTKFGTFSVSAKMYGKIITKEKGENGFGYDSLFIPANYDKTLAELSDEEKNAISHRFKALKLAKILLKTLQKAYQ
ncbi:RdgB/HAM1 family non-canonical purine NTP pyrophosphatase [Campylobacter helveticus]|uniref:RdgB/HAM1 family non-canonical purine NTP pyrophosphatase n=1 Tax=Campylobacter helveticus TaxID=28898 RepID=UPI0011168E08|nr:RdgB/HAM1 family non-canonical purine NTP pyrophosphatase [Campylobacter helveticus]MCR2060069.1 RdgB/HAM1 family non-canonical purine NTP pyrophosphatase [Campylobacter helveticus]MCR2065079.1 RdgB/HAM1 family non-canonical purine NTP pyrophosphatase [Campylobacter helveticus]TNH33697.1 RdgB/HAM1 family non-canonical purine NTP pyrophosphatase [Campylobacter helveticus]TNH36906.1 RdgB/HAM1 family non-canonical purine NTP pyrophosphatase [Campylobacter helveticus]